MTQVTKIVAEITESTLSYTNVRLNLYVDDRIYEAYERKYLSDTSLERALTDLLEITRAEELETPTNRDEIEAQIFDDFLRLRRKGRPLKDLILQDILAHEDICNYHCP